MSDIIKIIEKKCRISKDPSETIREYILRICDSTNLNESEIESFITEINKASFGPNDYLINQDIKERVFEALEQEYQGREESQSVTSPSAGETDDTDDLIKSETGRKYSGAQRAKEDNQNIHISTKNYDRKLYPKIESIYSDIYSVLENKRHKISLINTSSYDITYICLILFVGIYTYYNDLGQPLKQWDEAIYATAAKAMIEHGYILIPHNYWSGGYEELAPFLEKPPLMMWLEAVSMLVFGQTEFGVRFFSATAAIAIGLLVYVFNRELEGRKSGLFGAVAFLLTPAMYAGTNAGKTGGVETVYIFFASLFVFLTWWAITKTEFQLLPYASVALGVAIMTKGFAVGPFLLVVFPLGILRPQVFKTKSFIKAIGVGLAIIVPWPLYAWIRYGDQFIYQIFTEQVLGRATGGFGRLGGMFSFMKYPYFDIIPSQFDPWIYFLFPAIAILLIQARSNRAELRDRLFLIWWGVLIFGFYLPTGNHPWYILPIYVPAAMLIGQLLSRASDGNHLALVGVIIGAIPMFLFSWRLATLGPFANRKVSTLPYWKFKLGSTPLITYIVGVISVLSASFLENIADKHLRPDEFEIGKHVYPAIIIIGLVMFLITPASVSGLGATQKPLAQQIDANTSTDTTVYISDQALSTQPFMPFEFYSDRRLGRINVSNLDTNDSAKVIIITQDQIPEISHQYQNITSTESRETLVAIRLNRSG